MGYMISPHTCIRLFNVKISLFFLFTLYIVGVRIPYWFKTTRP